MEIETGFQVIQAGKYATSSCFRYLTINVVGENTVLQLNILETGVLILVVQNSSPTRLRLVGDEFWTTRVITPVSKMFRWRIYNTSSYDTVYPCPFKVSMGSLLPNLWCSVMHSPSVVWFRILSMRYCRDWDRLRDILVISPFDISFVTNLSSVALVFCFVLAWMKSPR